MTTGQLAKMKIIAYKDVTFSDKTGDEYEVLINPESYSLEYGTENNSKTAQGSSEEITSFNKRSKQSMSFKFLFDGTGVIKSGDILSAPTLIGGGSKRDVVKDIADFKKVVYSYDPSTHQAPFVQLSWGKLLYNCQLTKMTISFKLFQPDGTPIRAEADCTFQGVIDEEKLALIENRQSPDLTHIIMVKKGDTLPLLCYREYGDSKYYYQVARYNRLTNFKKLKPGTRLIFPPISK